MAHLCLPGFLLLSTIPYSAGVSYRRDPGPFEKQLEVGKGRGVSEESAQQGQRRSGQKCTECQSLQRAEAWEVGGPAQALAWPLRD